MADEKFSDNLLRLLAAQVSVLTVVVAAQQMFGRGYFSLSAAEKTAVSAAVLGNFQVLTPEFLAGPKPLQQAGFGIPAAAPMKETS